MTIREKIGEVSDRALNVGVAIIALIVLSSSITTPILVAHYYISVAPANHTSTLEKDNEIANLLTGHTTSFTNLQLSLNAISTAVSGVCRHEEITCVLKLYAPAPVKKIK